MTVSAPPRPPSPAPEAPESKPMEREEIEALVEALIEEARREQRRRRRRYWAVVTLVALVAVVLIAVVDRSAQSETASSALAARSSAAGAKAESRIAFIREPAGGYAGVLWVMNPDGSGQRSLGPAVPRMDWSPDGQKIAFATSGDIYVANADGSRRQRLTTARGLDNGPVWSPDGRRIAFLSSRGGGIYVMNADGTEQRLLTRVRGPEYPHGLAWSPNGQEIAFTSGQDGNDEIYVMSADGSRARRLTHNNVRDSHPVWSPDGQRIAFDARVDGNPDIWVIDQEAKEPRRVTVEPAEDVTGVWTPDGTSIVYCSNRSGDQQLWRIPAGGGPAVQLTHEGGFGPRLSPDGKFFYYLRSRAAGGLRRVPVEGGREEELVASVRDRNWAVTPEGIYIFQASAGATGLYGVNQPAELLFYDLHTRRLNTTGFTSPRRIGNNGIAVSPDGQRLVFPQLDEAGSSIMVVEHFR